MGYSAPRLRPGSELKVGGPQFLDGYSAPRLRPGNEGADGNSTGRMQSSSTHTAAPRSDRDSLPSTPGVLGLAATIEKVIAAGDYAPIVPGSTGFHPSATPARGAANRCSHVHDRD